jgi:hypothetical protein
MSLTTGPDPATDLVTGDPFDVLRTVPLEAQLLLRDRIAGLEAEAGAARAEARRQQRIRVADTNRLLLQLAGAQSERDAALAERDAALRGVGFRSGGRSLLMRGKRWLHR